MATPKPAAGRLRLPCGAKLGTHATALYFRRVADALRLVEAFPEFELADGTRMPSYTRPGVWRAGGA